MDFSQFDSLKSDSVDVMLLLEGTYPFVSGGVSVWVADIIESMPTIRFGIVFLGAWPSLYKKLYFKLPSNLVHLEIHFLFPEILKSSGQDKKNSKINTCPHIHQKEKICTLHDNFSALQEGLFSDLANPKNNLFNADYFLYSKESWEYIVESYEKHAAEPSFIDYFWTVRNIHTPLWTLGKILKSLIPAKLLHSPSTGYAGFLGCLISESLKIPLITTEHGIYTRERYLELIRSPLVQAKNQLENTSKDFDYLKTMWLKFFDTLSRLTYQHSRYIIGLYEGARLVQINMGADKNKTRVIPNGINIDKFKNLKLNKNKSDKKIVGLIGRLVRIKSTLNYIRALGIVTHHLKNIEGWICFIGSEEEDYIAEAKLLVKTLDLSDVVKFVENKTSAELLVDLDLLVLSSVSEGMPLTVLEAFATGVPVVVSDVGSCKELVEGKNKEDSLLGLAGLVVPSNNVEALAHAMMQLLSSDEKLNAAGLIAQKRVNLYYNQDLMISEYQKVYGEFL